jgi:hypothetical protein
LILLQLVDVGGVVGREQRVGQRPQRDAIEEEPGAAADDEGARLERRPCEPGPRRDVVAIGVDGVEPLQVVAQSQVQGQVGRGTPLVLHVEPEVRVALFHLGLGEGL